VSVDDETRFGGGQSGGAGEGCEGGSAGQHGP
jgi:hypothetical protein